MTMVQLEEFFGKLAGVEGCNVQGRGSVYDFDHKTWECAGEHFFTERILLSMDLTFVEREAFIDKCIEYEADCDCEVLFSARGQLLAHYLQ